MTCDIALTDKTQDKMRYQVNTKDNSCIPVIKNHKSIERKPINVTFFFSKTEENKGTTATQKCNKNKSQDT